MSQERSPLDASSRKELQNPHATHTPALSRGVRLQKCTATSTGPDTALSGWTDCKRPSDASQSVCLWWWLFDIEARPPRGFSRHARGAEDKRTWVQWSDLLLCPEKRTAITMPCFLELTFAFASSSKYRLPSSSSPEYHHRLLHHEPRAHSQAPRLHLGRDRFGCQR